MIRPRMALRGIRHAVPIGRLREAEAVAAAALFLASDGSRHVVGLGLVVDGGISRL